MPSNIEIKAYSRDFEHQKSIAEQLSKSKATLLIQEDVFFPTTNGRLKLRIFSPNKAELIQYDRPDVQGIKQSNYIISKTSEPETLKQVLSTALGVSTIVKKKRHLYLVGQTRIHLDEVDNLGNFIELEVVLKPGQSPEEGQSIAQDIMEKMSIKQEDLISCAYADLLEKKL